MDEFVDGNCTLDTSRQSSDAHAMCPKSISSVIQEVFDHSAPIQTSQASRGNIYSHVAQIKADSRVDGGI